MEATGHARWFERLLEELHFELWIGDPLEIRARRVRNQKTDRHDAQLLLKLLMEDRFPRIWVGELGKSRSATTPVAWAWFGADAHTNHESVASHSPERRSAAKEAAGGHAGRAQLESFVLAPWASRRRKELLELLDRLNPSIRGLNAAVEQEATRWPEVRRLMTHPGVGSLTVRARDSPEILWVCSRSPTE
jgi:transposase